MAAQNKLGELFVDIGVGGLGKTLKGLNSVSASFLLTKNAAVQMTKPIADMTKKFGENAIGVRKMTVAFKGMTDDMSQRIQALSKIKSLNNLVPALSKIQQEYSHMVTGRPVDNNFTKGLNQLGLSMRDYTNDAQGYLNLLSDIQDRISTMDKSKIESIFDFLPGFDWAEMIYAKGQKVSYRDLPALANTLTKEEIDQAIKGQEDLNKLQLTVFQALDKIFVKNSDKIIAIINRLTGVAENAPKFVDKIEKKLNTKEKQDAAITAGIVTGSAITGGNIAGFPGLVVGGVGAAAAKAIKEVRDNMSIPSGAPVGITPFYNPALHSNKKPTGNNQQFEYQPDLDLKGRSDLPSDVPTNQIGAINFNIYSDNADEISNRVNNNLDNVLNSSRYYQTIV